MMMVDHRDPLREAHPGEDRIQPTRLPVREVDAARDPADVAADDVVMAYQLDPRRVWSGRRAAPAS
jgi:hypothetical protein